MKIRQIKNPRQWGPVAFGIFKRITRTKTQKGKLQTRLGGYSEYRTPATWVVKLDGVEIGQVQHGRHYYHKDGGSLYGSWREIRENLACRLGMDQFKTP